LHHTARFSKSCGVASPAPDALVIRSLRDAAVHLPPHDLAAQCGLPLFEIHASLARLAAAGFNIESRPGLGCKLLGEPDRLIADDLHARLGECPISREILVFEETGSTNDIASNLGRAGHPGGIAIFAERQTSGRGRFGRKWTSASHEGLWFSLLMRPELPLANWPRLTTWAGVCVAAICGPQAKLKWPNDVLIHGKKTAGILSESATDSAGNAFVVVGIGVNLNQTEFPPELAQTATSLRLAQGLTIDRAKFAAALLTELNLRLGSLQNDFQTTLADAETRSAILGQWVELYSGADFFTGLAERLDENGNLLIRQSDGSLQRMTAGEISSRHPDHPR
jgi:BirA family transcriptional regulator, biotin operon repressor / biotin---[acetyl-CoA-carboxylase] ligase